MRSHPRRAAYAVLALIVALLVIASPMAERDRAQLARPGSNREAAAHDASLSTAGALAAVPSRRVLSFDAPGYFDAGRSTLLSLLWWVAIGLSAWVLCSCAGLTRRGRAPPFVRA